MNNLDASESTKVDYH